MDARHLLYFAPSSGAEDPAGPNLYDGLSAVSQAGWQIHLAADRAQAGDLLERRTFGAAMVKLDQSACGPLRSDLESFSGADRYLPWVALLRPEDRQDPDVGRLLWECFYDFHTLPADIQRLLTTLGHADGMASLARAAAEPSVEASDEPQMVGVCPAMQQVFTNIRKIAAVDAPVLITGESGTGKELAARAIHERSRRSEGPFVAVNCAALPETLIQSELFGYERGAFTGAQRRKLGSIESANGGTLFLDEIGDIALDLQVNLLRFLEESAIQRVGNPREIPVDVRVIAATHTDMERATARGRFREDLYFRLNVLRLDMPALREREGDMEVLAQFFFRRFRRETSHRVKGFSSEALQTIAEYGWPGNVREIINRVRRATVMCEGRLITPSDLGLAQPSRSVRLLTLDEVRAEAEKDAILGALKASGHNLSKAARALGTSRPRLYRLMAKYEIEG